MIAPVVTIFVRHGDINGKPCKYTGDELAKRCSCRKHLRWTANGKQYRQTAGTRSWTEAEQAKRDKEDQLAGRLPDKPEEARGLQDSIDTFLKDKKQGVSADVVGKYTRELDRLREHCALSGVLTVQGITRELLAEFCATWDGIYPSSQTRLMVRARCRCFLRYCYESQWIPRIPMLPKIKADVAPTLPLTADEYGALLKAIDTTFADPVRRATVRALFQLMRWSGLANTDALTLERSAIQRDEAKGIYRVVTSRQKTGTHVSVPLPPKVAEELLALANDNTRYVFWDGKDDIAKRWRKYFIPPVFKAAKIERGGNMMSHRLRDTFAVDLLEKGVPLEEVSKLLGHESIKTTERHYSKWMKGRQDRLDALVTGTWEVPSKKRKRGAA
jgi:site-specific recombinase XerD